MTLASAMRSAVMAHVGVLQPSLVVDDDVEITTYEQAREVLGTTEEIAEQAGYGAPGQYRKGTPEYTRRRSFMRQLQRAEKRRTGGPGQSRSGANVAPQIVTVAKIRANRRNTPTGVSDVIRLMGMKGTTTSYVRAMTTVSSDTRSRTIEARVYTQQSVYRSVGWPMRGRVPRDDDAWADLGARYFQAFARAYGVGEMTVDDEPQPIFQFTIGRDDETEAIDYDYT